MHVWIITVSDYGHGGPEHRTVDVAADEDAARELVFTHGAAEGCYLWDWAIVERDGQIVSVGLEADECEVTATRWEVKAGIEAPKRRRKLHEPLFMD